MKIGIDARMLGPGFGIARYVEQLVLHLETLDTHNEYVIFLRKENFDLFVPKNKNFKKVLADIPWYGWKEQVVLPFLFLKEKVDLMHFPHWNIPILYPKKFVVTIHDLIMFHFPRQEASTHGPFVYFLKDQMHRFLVRYASTRAKCIFVTSEFTQKDMHETLGVPNEKMLVTYQAPFGSVNNEQETVDKKQNSGDVLNKYGVKNPYVLYVGAAYPHKNLENLLKAWKIFGEKHPEYQLVLAGKENFFYKRLKNNLPIFFAKGGPASGWQSSNLPIFTGFVSDSELEVLYAEAKLFVFPSLYEGFGLPPLEALARGVPVVASNASCLPEVLQDAVLYFDPTRPEEMAEVLEQGITAPIVGGEEFVKRYSWDELARQTVELYK